MNMVPMYRKPAYHVFSRYPRAGIPISPYTNTHTNLRIPYNTYLTKIYICNPH